MEPVAVRGIIARCSSTKEQQNLLRQARIQLVTAPAQRFKYSNMSPSPVVRHAMREDVPAILELIRELADYEHELSSVEATEEKLLSTIAFAPSSSTSTVPAAEETESTSSAKPARCLVLISPDGTPAGIALYFYNYSTWRARPGIYLEDLYVRQSERKKGYGKRLLVELAKEVVAMNGGRLEWSVLKWNEPSIKFYESIGANMMSEWVGMRVDGEGLRKLAALLD